jgi:hypothetical protein
MDCDDDELADGLAGGFDGALVDAAQAQLSQQVVL